MPNKFDPQLHILRSIANSLKDQRDRHEAQSARHKLYTALEAGDWLAARDWLEALEIAFHRTTPALDERTNASAERAIAIIRSGLEP